MPYRRKLIGQKLEWHNADASRALRSFIMSHPKNAERNGSVSNKYSPSMKSGFYACISSRIATVIHIAIDRQVNYNCFNEPFAVSPCEDLY